MNRLRPAALATVALALAVCARATAQNLGFLDKSAISYFTDRDNELLREAGQRALETLTLGQATSWENPSSGASGAITVLRVFAAADGRPCRRLLIQNRARGIEGESRQVLCKSPDRGWLFDPDARP